MLSASEARSDGKELRLRDARREKGLTQQALAEAVGVTRRRSTPWESGEYNPTIRLCRAICRALGKTLDELFWRRIDAWNGTTTNTS